MKHLRKHFLREMPAFAEHFDVVRRQANAGQRRFPVGQNPHPFAEASHFFAQIGNEFLLSVERLSKFLKRFRCGIAHLPG